MKIRYLMAASSASLAAGLCSMSDDDGTYTPGGAYTNRGHRNENKPYVHQDWPMCFYGPEGQAQNFNGPLEVPEGWVNRPEDVGKKNAKVVIPGYDEAVAAAEEQAEQEGVNGEEDDSLGADKTTETGELTGDPIADLGKDLGPGDVLTAKLTPTASLPPIGEITKPQIIERLNALKVSHNASWKEERLYELLKGKLQEMDTPEGGNKL